MKSSLLSIAKLFSASSSNPRQRNDSRFSPFLGRAGRCTEKGRRQTVGNFWAGQFGGGAGLHCRGYVLTSASAAAKKKSGACFIYPAVKGERESCPIFSPQLAVLLLTLPPKKAAADQWQKSDPPPSYFFFFLLFLRRRSGYLARTNGREGKRDINLWA